MGGEDIRESRTRSGFQLEVEKKAAQAEIPATGRSREGMRPLDRLREVRMRSRFQENAPFADAMSQGDAGGLNKVTGSGGAHERGSAGQEGR